MGNSLLVCDDNQKGRVEYKKFNPPFFYFSETVSNFVSLSPRKSPLPENYFIRQGHGLTSPS